jgi:endonuclease YncB( thermonuclease family)
MGFRLSWLAFAVIGLLLAFSSRSAGAGSLADIVGPAFVQEDGSLRVGNRTIWLYGIYLPPTGRTCETILRPTRCGSRAALALDFKIQGFVFCDQQGVYSDGSVSAVCFVRRTAFSPGDDLAAYLLTQGWALALPDAPFGYVALERIAENRGLGVWGFQADVIIPRQRGGGMPHRSRKLGL